MPLASDPCVIVKDFFKAYYSGDPTPSWRTSPPSDKAMTFPHVIFRNVQELERVGNVGGTRFITKSEVWAYIYGTSKSDVTNIRNNMWTAHKAHWKNPGSSVDWIGWDGMANDDQLDKRPPVYGRIIKLTVKWMETTSN